MFLCKEKIKEKIFIHWGRSGLFLTLAIIAIMACTSDLDNGGAALVGPSFGITPIPQNPQVNKAGNQTFTTMGGLAPYTYSLSTTDIGAIDPITGVFTALAIAGTATITVVDQTGATGTTNVTVLPLPLVVAPGSAILTAAGDQAFTVAATASGSGIVACSISDSDISPTTIAKPTVAAAALVCTATATAVPAAGAANETYTITITDTQNGDIASAQLTLAHPTGSPGF